MFSFTDLLGKKILFGFFSFLIIVIPVSVLVFNNYQESKVKEEINNVQNLSDLLKAKDEINLYCQKNIVSEKDCKEKLLKILREKGDKIKDDLVNAIDKKNHQDQLKAILSLYPILLLAENAHGEGTFFSTANIAWAKNELKKKINKWINDEIERIKSYTGNDLDNAIEQLNLLLKSFETASGAEGIYASNEVIKKAKAELEKLKNKGKTQITNINEKNKKLENEANVDDFRTIEEKIKEIEENNSEITNENNIKNDTNKQSTDLDENKNLNNEADVDDFRPLDEKVDDIIHIIEEDEGESENNINEEEENTEYIPEEDPMENPVYPEDEIISEPLPDDYIFPEDHPIPDENYDVDNPEDGIYDENLENSVYLLE